MKRAPAIVRVCSLLVAVGGFAVVVRAGVLGVGAGGGRMAPGVFVAGVGALCCGLAFLLTTIDGRG